jgi:CTD small phosphatase-like protein 2
MFIKDLRIINRPLSDLILVDNAAYSYFFQLENGIPIVPYYHGSNDFELRELEKYLMQMVMEKDVRRLNRETFKLHRYIDYYNTPNKLVEDLYVNKI